MSMRPDRLTGFMEVVEEEGFINNTTAFIRSLKRPGGSIRARLSATITASILVLLAASACGGSPIVQESPTSFQNEPPITSSSLAEGSPEVALNDVEISVGSGPFSEGPLLCEVYAAALRANGADVRTSTSSGNRESYIAALQQGLIDVVPDYSGALLRYLDPKSSATSSDDVFAALQTAVPPGLEVLTRSLAEDREAIVVTQTTSESQGLKSLDDLAPVAPSLVFGGAPNWKTKNDGLEALEEDYGLTFKSFAPLDAGGPLTLDALLSGRVQVASLFTVDPGIAANNLVVLDDPKNFFLAENIVPLVASVNATAGVRDTLDAVSAKLDTAQLAGLLTRVEAGEDRSIVAEEWVAANLTRQGDYQTPDTVAEGTALTSSEPNTATPSSTQPPSTSKQGNQQASEHARISTWFSEAAASDSAWVHFKAVDENGETVAEVTGSDLMNLKKEQAALLEKPARRQLVDSLRQRMAAEGWTEIGVVGEWYEYQFVR